MGIEQGDSTKYDRYIRKGPSSKDSAIRSGAARSVLFLLFLYNIVTKFVLLRDREHFRNRGDSSAVKDEALIRLMNASVWEWEETRVRLLPSFHVYLELIRTHCSASLRLSTGVCRIRCCDTVHHVQ